MNDWQAIADVVAKLAYTQDSRDWDGLRAQFAERVLLDLSTHFGDDPVEFTPAELADKARTVLQGFDCTHHSPAGLLTEVTGDTATCRAYVTAYHHVPAPPGVVDYCIMRGFWSVRLVRTDEGWRVREWAVERTAPWEGSEDVYRLAAERS
ncbi:nuclear transport factor 2 family protein [Amycolatopsis jejuensis]|uniref:nuclear transport factor 2 family protein n=1 Tax=Amycolatopsis jejuensis TaxID=330084 RepID=UPI000527549B|nr:nuclear transport factor 2 family protein [Amycolatopsis jejuensis]